MESHLSVLTAFFLLHPHGALIAIFAAALLEALALIGTVIPGSSVVFIGGALVGLNVLNPWWTAVAAVSGAILGDSISYWLGQHYRDRIGGVWPFRKFPRLLQRGQLYFSCHGGKSVFFGRFLSPVRAIVPVVAGMSDMAAPRFLALNILSALAWAAVHLIPGVVFGASLQLAGAVSTRLVLLLLLLAGFLWGLVRLGRIVLRYGWPRLLAWRDGLLKHARDRSGRWARAVRLLFDPASPQGPTLLLATLLSIGGVWIFFAVLEDVMTQDSLVQLDQTIYAALQALRTEWGDGLMVAATTFGGAEVLLPLILVVALIFSAQREWRTLCYWLAATVLGELAVTGLKYTLKRVRPDNPIYVGIEQFSFPSGHTTMSVVTYGFLIFLLVRGKSMTAKAVLALAATCAVALIAFSRLYLGVHWFSDVLASLSLGLTWVALLSLAYMHSMHPQHRQGWPLALMALVTVVSVGSWHIARDHGAEMTRYSAQAPAHTLLANWQTSGWHTLPAARAELDGDAEEPFSVQWAAPQPQLLATLLAAGWQVPPPWTVQTTLLWLLPPTPLQQLPVLPKFNHGASPKVTVVKLLNPHQRMVLRLWSVPYVIATTAGVPVPLWQGSATVEQLYHPAALMSLIKTNADFATAPGLLKRRMQAQGLFVESREGPSGTVLLIW